MTLTDDTRLDTEQVPLAPDEGMPGPGELPPTDDRRIRNTIDAVVAVSCGLFVFWQLHPDLILADTTPAGGDMGAHVWAFAELRDNLLPNFRLSGWTPDWYAGFPVFHFYMVLPFLGMVALNMGFSGSAALIPAGIAIALSGTAFMAPVRRNKIILTLSAGLVAIFGISIPYGQSFKLMTVAGVVSMPVSAYAFGRMARMPYPTPALFSIVTLFFLFDKNFTIYGGNIASTLAGEFAFSIAVSLAFLYLGSFIRLMREGTHAATTAVLLAITGLTHLLPAFFALAATGVIWLAFGAGDLWAAVKARRQPHLVPDDAVDGVTSIGNRSLTLVLFGAVSGLLSAFWVLPFFWRRTYLNDMGWEKTRVRGANESIVEWFFHGNNAIFNYLVPNGEGDGRTTDLRVWAILALVGAVLSFAFHNRLGKSLVFLGVILALAFIFVPQGRLWNARILPFWYLVIYLLAALAIGEVIRAFAVVFGAQSGRRPRRAVLWVAAPLALVLALGYHGLHLWNLGPLGPLGGKTVQKDDGGFEYQAMGGLITSGSKNFVTDWSRWNYNGYERKDRYPEYRGIVDEMFDIGVTNGCGMSLWEYNNDQNNYGTPMAMMLLPHWTNGCIGSMEGLYFEASSTTPFHFLMQTELSTAASSAQRDMPYTGFDIDMGVDHLQLLGVQYYLSFTTEATEAAHAHPELVRVGGSGPWTVWEVLDAPRVQALSFEPAVTTSGQHQEGDGAWLCESHNEQGRCQGPALDWFLDTNNQDVALAATGPAEWQRLDYGDTPEYRSVPEAEVSNVVWGRDSISFTVDQIGTPVLVKASYFPNWRASGASGPYRVAPNLMLVVPTDTDVTLTYGRTPVDYLAIFLSLLGLGLLYPLSKLRLRVINHRDTDIIQSMAAPAPADMPTPVAVSDDGSDLSWVTDPAPPPPPDAGADFDDVFPAERGAVEHDADVEAAERVADDERPPPPDHPPES